MGGVTSGRIKKLACALKTFLSVLKRKLPLLSSSLQVPRFSKNVQTFFEFLKRNLRLSAAWTGSAVVLCGVIEGIFSCAFAALRTYDRDVANAVVKTAI